MTRFATIILMLLASVAGLTAQLSTGGMAVSVRNFTLSGFDERGLPWHLHGTETLSNGYYVTIDAFKLDFELKKPAGNTELLKTDDNGRLVVTLESDICNLNSATQEIKSGSPVKVAIGKNIHITGIGYDVDLRRKVILIRSAVSVKMPIAKNPASKKHTKKKDKQK